MAVLPRWLETIRACAFVLCSFTVDSELIFYLDICHTTFRCAIGFLNIDGHSSVEI